MEIAPKCFILLLLPIHAIALVITFDGQSSKTISEDETSETLLTFITVSSVTAGQTVSCDLNPTQSKFWVKLDPTTGNYGLYLIGMANLDFNSQSVYNLKVECTDNVVATTKDFTVNVDKNKSPTVSNLHNYTEIDTSTTTTGTLVFSVTASDPENDQLTFTMNCYVLNVLSTCPFEIYDSGEILTTADFLAYSVSSYDLKIEMTDDHNNQIGPYSLTVTVTGLNTPPVIKATNLPYTDVVLENTALGASVYQVSITDPDVGDVHTYTATFTPSTASNYFSIDSSTGLVTTSTTSRIDYDTLSFHSCQMAITVSDNYASDTKTLTINIANVNEAPQFAKTMYSLSGPEASAGTSFGIPNYDVTDPDGDTTTYGTDCVSFNIKSDTGEVTLSIDYDRDDETVASSVTCGVTVTDGVLTSTATLQIFIENINDNKPNFKQNSYSFHVSPYSPIGTIIDSVSAVDADVGSFGVVSYAVLSGTYSNYFGIDTSGNMYLKSNISDTISGLTVSVQVRAYDSGSNKDTVTVSFTIQATTTLSTTTTTDRALTFFDSPENIAWFSALMIILLGLLVFLGFEAYRSQLVFKICSSCNDCHLPRRRKLILDNDLEDHDDEEDLRDDTPSPTLPPMTPVSVGNDSLGWNAWNNSDKSQGFF